MLESISLTDFRRHESVHVDLVDGCNVLSGKSASGKSTIIRALRWVAFNKPTGDSILRWGSESARVKLAVDGHQVVRKRGTKSNIYKLDGGVYKSFGQDVPEDIAKLLNVSIDLNFSGQHSSPFLFSLTPGEAARELNAVVNLDRIDEVLGNLASEVRKSKSEIGVCEERLKQAEDRARNTGWVDSANKLLKEAEAADAHVHEVESSLNDADRLVDKVRDAITRSSSASTDLSDLVDKTTEIDALVDKVSVLSLKVNSAAESLSAVRRAQAQYDRIKADCDRVEQEMAELEKGRCPLCGIMK